MASLMLAFSVAGLWLVNNPGDSVLLNTSIKSNANVSSVYRHEDYRQDRLDRHASSSISDDSPFTAYLNWRTSDDTVGVLLKGWISERPSELLGFILQMRDRELRLKFLGRAMELWHNDAPDALYEWVSTVSGSPPMTELCGTESFAPKLCVEYAEKLADIGQQNRIINHQLRPWLIADSDEVIAWLVKGDERYQRFGANVFSALIELDFDTALFLLAQISDRDLSTSTEIADLIVQKLYQTQNSVQTNASANAALALSDSIFKDRLLLALAPVLFELGDTYNSIVVLDAMSDGSARDALQHNFVRKLTEQQGAEAALQYLAQLNDQRKMQELIDTVMVRRSRDDLIDAHALFKTLNNPHPETILSLTQVAIEQKNIPIAVELLDSLKNTSNNIETAEYDFQLARLMYDDNPESAFAYLDANLELSTEDKKALMAYLANTSNFHSKSESDLAR